MVQSVAGLFGMSPQEAEADVYKNSSRAEDLFRGVGSLFGYENENVRKAKTIETAMQDVLSKITPEEAKDPSILYPMLTEGFKRYGLPKEALIASQAGQEAIASYDTNKSNIAVQQQSIEDKKTAYLGSVSSAFSNALDTTEDPKKRQALWDTAIKKIAKYRPEDAQMLKDLPPSEWATALSIYEDESQTAGTRQKEKTAAAKVKYEENKLAETLRHNKKQEFLTDKKIDIQYKIEKLKEEGRDTRALEKEASTIDKIMHKDIVTQAQLPNKTEIMNLGTKIGDREISGELKVSTGLEGDELKKALPFFKGTYSKFLSQNDADGLPLYSPPEAKALALQETSKNINEEGYFFKNKTFKGTAAITPKKPAVNSVKFTVGQTYTDTSGNKAVYKGNNQWDPVEK